MQRRLKNNDNGDRIAMRQRKFLIRLVSRVGRILRKFSPSTFIRRWRLASACRTHMPFTAVMPGIGVPMWIRPKSYFSTFYVSGNVFEQEVVAFMKSRIGPGMTVFDIGANIGYFTLLTARLVGPTGTVIAFEPGQDAFDSLVANIDLNGFNNVYAKQIALCDKNGYEIYWQSKIERMNVYNSLINVEIPSHISQNDFQKHRIPVRYLDSIVAEERLPLPDFVKIDVEGAEMMVIDGMKDILSADKSMILVFEGSKVACQKNKYSLRELVNAIEHFGFSCKALNRYGSLRQINWADQSWPGGMLVAER